MNPLFQMMNNAQPDNIITRFMRFRQNFRGDPQQAVQQMLNSGRISQQQYNNAVQMAQQMQKMIGGR